MKNTQIEYSSSERTTTVYPEMEGLLPALSEEELSALEADILENGCYTPITVNEDMVIIDGHNRYRICQKHDLPFRMQVFHFDDLLEAKQWALETQKGRRNLDKWTLGKIALKLKPDLEAKAKANMSARGKKYSPKEGLATLPNLPLIPMDARKEMATSVGIGERTMGKVMQIDKHAPEAVKEALDKKELSINQGYNLTRQLLQIPKEQRENMCIDQLELESARNEVRIADAETDRKANISKLFNKIYGMAVRLIPTEDNVSAWTEFSCMDPTDMEDMVRESYDLADRFKMVAEILATRILPTDWHFKSPAYMDEIGVVSTPNADQSAK